MAPLHDPQPQPSKIMLLSPRQAAESQRIVTFVVTRATTTYTTIIPLGSETTIPVQQSPLTVPTADITPLPTAALINPVGEDSSNRGKVAGAVIGSVVGSLIVFWFLWKCRPFYSFWNTSSRVSYRSYSSDSYYSVGAPPMRQRGGGGGEWERENRIKHPDRTWRKDGRRDGSHERRGSEARSVGIEGWTRPRRGSRSGNGCLAGLLGGGGRGRRMEKSSWARDRRPRSRSWSRPLDKKMRGGEAWSEVKGGRYKPGTIDD